MRSFDKVFRSLKCEALILKGCISTLFLRGNMLKFYNVDTTYTDYLRKHENKVPFITYSNNNKFVCGVVLLINDYHYFAPISSNIRKQKTNIIIKNKKGEKTSSIKFSFMFPIPLNLIKEMNFNVIRKYNPKHTDLLQNELKFCRKNESLITNKALKIYNLVKYKNAYIKNFCCDYSLLEKKYDEWIKNH
jgi:protein AbiQ